MEPGAEDGHAYSEHHGHKWRKEHDESHKHHEPGHKHHKHHTEEPTAATEGDPAVEPEAAVVQAPVTQAKVHGVEGGAAVVVSPPLAAPAAAAAAADEALAGDLSSSQPFVMVDAGTTDFMTSSVGSASSPGSDFIEVPAVPESSSPPGSTNSFVEIGTDGEELAKTRSAAAVSNCSAHTEAARAEQRAAIQARDTAEQEAEAALRAAAAIDLAGWEGTYAIGQAARAAANQEDQASFVRSRDGSVPGNAWERVAWYTDFSKKHGEKDVARLKSVLISLKSVGLLGR